MKNSYQKSKGSLTVKTVAIIIVAIILLLTIIGLVVQFGLGGFENFINNFKKEKPNDSIELVDPFSVGDNLTSLYFNTDLNVDEVNTILAQLDWSKSGIIATRENYSELQNVEGIIEWDIMYLISTYEPPATFEEFLGKDNNILQWALENGGFQVLVWRYVYENGDVSYMICYHGSSGIWVSQDIGAHAPLGWQVNGYDNQIRNSEEMKPLSYVNDQQNIWYSLMGKSKIVKENKPLEPTHITNGETISKVYINPDITHEMLQATYTAEGNYPLVVDFSLVSDNSRVGSLGVLPIVSITENSSDLGYCIVFISNSSTGPIIPIYAEYAFSATAPGGRIINFNQGWQNIESNGCFTFPVDVEMNPNNEPIKSDYQIYVSTEILDSIFSSTPFK